MPSTSRAISLIFAFVPGQTEAKRVWLSADPGLVRDHRGGAVFTSGCANEDDEISTCRAVWHNRFLFPSCVRSHDIESGADRLPFDYIGTSLGWSGAWFTTSGAPANSLSDGAILDRIRVRIDSANAAATPGEIDKIRIGDTWLDVVAVPEPSSFAPLSLAAGFPLSRGKRGNI